MKIKSGYAILDVTTGRAALKKHFDDSCHYPEKPETIPVVIYGEISSVQGRDDGTSQEFEVIVSSVHVDHCKGKFNAD